MSIECSGPVVVLRTEAPFSCKAYRVSEAGMKEQSYPVTADYREDGNIVEMAPSGAAWVPRTNVLLIVTTPFQHELIKTNPGYELITEKTDINSFQGQAIQ